jgi:hypothetical protein
MPRPIETPKPPPRDPNRPVRQIAPDILYPWAFEGKDVECPPLSSDLIAYLRNRFCRELSADSTLMADSVTYKVTLGQQSVVQHLVNEYHKQLNK